VGVDIACRMKMSVLDIPPADLSSKQARFIRAIEQECRFGVGASFEGRRRHAVMDDDWSCSPVADSLKDKAWSQLGTSGSGNHFVEFGILTLETAELDLAAGEYLALLSHSGSRGAGNLIATHYSKLARRLHPELSTQLAHLAWLEMDSAEGREYWRAMQLMGRYAAANHEVIHRELVRTLKCHALATVENHHNFAWRERHGDRDVIVHRKGATPAGDGVLGIIPGSMADPGYVVRGRGNAASLESAAHGAGRVMSRSAARDAFTWSAIKQRLAQANVTLISAGIDENPGVYKNINDVMRDQNDLVDIIARFEPRIVKMAPEGEKPED